MADPERRSDRGGSAGSGNDSDRITFRDFCAAVSVSGRDCVELAKIVKRTRFPPCSARVGIYRGAMLARSRTIIAALGMLGVCAPTTSFGASVPENRWEVDYGPTKCKLIRHFTAGGVHHRLIFERGWSFGGHDWTLHGAGLPVYSTATAISLTVDAPHRTHRFKTNPYMFDTAEQGAIGWNDSEEHVFEDLQDDQTIRLTGARKLDVSLNLPNLGKAKQALQACEDDLFAGWGIDAKQLRSQSADAKPANFPGRWVTTDDYPRTDFVNKHEGTTTFLLTIGADGAVPSCRVIGSSGFASLDAQTCALLVRRAAFQPARDDKGKAVASFYINEVRWRVPR